MRIRNYLRSLSWSQVCMLILGILIIGISVAAFRLSSFGVDPFTCMNLGISGYLHMSFGNWQLLMNLLILVVVFFTLRKCIGLGTVINMVFVGYLADFFCWMVTDLMKPGESLGFRLICLGIGLLCGSLGAALYMSADLGISPYDAVAYVISNATREKISFRMGRILSDITVMIIGILACLAAKGSVWKIVGLGTVINSLFNGPLIQFFMDQIGKQMKN